MTFSGASLRVLGFTFGLTIGLGSSACTFEPDKPLFGNSSPGELGNAWLSFGESYGCTLLSGCDLARPLASAADETIAVTVVDPTRNDPRGDLKFSTSNDRVLAVTASRLDSNAADATNRVYGVEVLAVAAGDVELRIERADGTLLDRAKIRVRDPARFDVAAEPVQALADDVVTVAVGRQVSVIGNVYDAAGEHLLANQEVVWTLPDLEVADLGRYELGGGARLVDEDRAVITGRRVGTTTLGARVAGIERTLHVVVVAPPGG